MNKANGCGVIAMSRSFVNFGCGALLSIVALSASAQETVRPYDGIQAGFDAYRLGEERRRSDFQQQLNLNEDLRAWSAPRSWPSETMWYGDAAWPAYGGWGSPYDYGYGYGSAAPVRGAWPYGLGGFARPTYATPYRQPVGRWEGQTGPNRWESHPIYDPPIVPYQAPPPVDSPWLDRTPYAVPRPRVPEWTDGQPGVPDTDFPPAAASSADEESELLPPPPAAVDEFDTPRRSREAGEPLVPEPPPRRPIREF